MKALHIGLLEKAMFFALSGLLCVTPCFASSQSPEMMPVQASVPDLPVQTPDSGETPEVSEGWRELEDGTRMYYRGGVFVTGLVKIEEVQYYFDEDGRLQTDVWKEFKKGKSYFGRDGARAVGLTKIGKKQYYFNSGGIMLADRKKKEGNTTYFLGKKGVLQGTKVGSKYYKPNGKEMNRVAAQDFETLRRAKGIVEKITKPKMTKAQKLKCCFDWVISKPYVTRRVFSNQKGWPAVYANDHFQRGGGNCFADGSAFAYLAKAVGYKKVYVCVDSDGRGGSGHCWTEINGLVYDPLFAEAKSYAGNYGVRYGIYILHPILHIGI